MFAFNTVLDLIHVVAIWTKRNLIFFVSYWKFEGGSESMLRKVPNFLGKSTSEHKTNNFALAVKRACVASVSERFRSKERGTRVSQRPREKMAQVKEQGGGGEEIPLPSFIFCLSFHFSRGQNRKSPSSVLFCSETKRKRLLRRLAVKWPIGPANTLLSHGPGNEETSRKWGSPSGSREAPESLWAPSSTQTANCKELRRCF